MPHPTPPKRTLPQRLAQADAALSAAYAKLRAVAADTIPHLTPLQTAVDAAQCIRAVDPLWRLRTALNEWGHANARRDVLLRLQAEDNAQRGVPPPFSVIARGVGYEGGGVGAST